jgi:deoxyribodipyrimidine photo-lyase
MNLFARTRDEKIEKYLNEISLNVKNFRDHLLIEPDELFKEDNSGYQVYSPFARKWMELAQTPLMRQRIQSQIEGFKYLDKLQSGVQEKIFSLSWSELLDKIDITNDTLLEFRKLNLKKVTIPIPKAGSIEAFKRLKEYKNDLSEYKDCRDYPALKKTSKFSIYLKNGSLTVPQILAYYELTPYKKKQSAEDTFYSELVWREFYYHILYRHPYVEKSCFLKIYDSIKWENSEKNFEKWKNGQTGFPIVDAGMRELKQTGWMHNRVRMIVASFLVKDLLIDWRWGEKYFMEQLLDGDLAPNNGGWQWAASTGCDPQPYFRIFNPWLQSLKFDSDGEYIFKYLPELIGKVSAKKIHEPLNIIGYPEPIVDHKVQREKALNLYKLAGKKIN